MHEEQDVGANWLSSTKASLATYKPLSTYSTLAARINVHCQLCKGSHATKHCPQSAADKTATVSSNNLCRTCLHPGHRAVQCNAKGCCAKCRGKHHTAGHGIQTHSNAQNHNPQQHSNSSQQPPTSHTSIHANQGSRRTYVITANRLQLCLCSTMPIVIQH